MKNLVVSVDERIPTAAKDDYLHMTPDEFLEAVSSGTVTFDENLFYNLDSLTADIYAALKESVPQEYVIYYIFADQEVNLDFKLEKKAKKYAVAPKEPVEEQPQQQEVKQEVSEPRVENNSPQAVEQKPNENYTNVGVDVLTNNEVKTASDRELMEEKWKTALSGKSTSFSEKKTNKPAKVILFGSSKGGTGKTFTCLLTAYRYAKTHPEEKVALADFDIIDGQIGITLMLGRPTMYDYYKLYKSGRNTFEDLYTCHTNSDKFSPNIDFYLAPEIDFPEVTNNNDFWNNVFTHLIKNYDTVFFDSGIDYLGKLPISKLYKIADKILITSNTSINSVKSVGKQLETLSGLRKNNVFQPEDRILDRVGVILTRVSPNSDINKVATDYLKGYTNIVAAFTNMDDQITRTQWYQEWHIWDNYPKICEYLDRIVK